MICSLRVGSGLLCMVAAFALVGCGDGGPKTYKVKGTLKQGGQPVSTPQGGGVQMTFVEVDASGNQKENQISANVAPDGTYEVDVPAGKYKLEIMIYDKYPGGKDLLNGKYNIQTTDKSVDVSASKTEDVDVTAG